MSLSDRIEVRVGGKGSLYIKDVKEIVKELKEEFNWVEINGWKKLENYEIKEIIDEKINNKFGPKLI